MGIILIGIYASIWIFNGGIVIGSVMQERQDKIVHDTITEGDHNAASTR